jgi:alkylation response protein AidB-like acyl-CoA dehydrogenase
MCSSTAAVGRADEVPGGYQVSGQWQFVSGCHNSEIFGATVARYREGEPMDAPNLYAIVPRPEFQIINTWHVGGLRGSGSHDVRLDDVFVPAERMVLPIGGHDSESPFLRFPLGSRLAYNKVGVSLGIARAAIDRFVDLASGKVPRFTSKTLRQRPLAHDAVASAEVRLRSGRALVFELVSEMWAGVCAGRRISGRERAMFQIACSDAARGCAQAVELVAEAAGTTANQLGEPLERAARDIRVVRQHITVAPQHIADGGRVLLGLEAEGMMLGGGPLRTPKQRPQA